MSQWVDRTWPMYSFRPHCNNRRHVVHQQEEFPSNQKCHFPHDTFTYPICRHYITDATSDQGRSFCKYAQCHFVHQISRKLQSCRAVSILSMTSSPLVTATSLAHAGLFLAHDQHWQGRALLLCVWATGHCTSEHVYGTNKSIALGDQQFCF